MCAEPSHEATAKADGPSRPDSSSSLPSPASAERRRLHGGRVSEVSGRCLGRVSEVSRKCLGGVSEVSRRCLGSGLVVAVEVADDERDRLHLDQLLGVPVVDVPVAVLVELRARLL